MTQEIELTCMVCNVSFMGKEPQMCCSGRECGCMGLPTEPVVCSEACYDQVLNTDSEYNQKRKHQSSQPLNPHQ